MFVAFEAFESSSAEMAEVRFPGGMARTRYTDPKGGVDEGAQAMAPEVL